MELRIRSFIFAALVAIASAPSCAFAAGANIAERALDEAWAAFSNCALQELPKYDDRISPAQTVARVVAWQCAEQAAQYLVRSRDLVNQNTPGLVTSAIFAERRDEFMRGEAAVLLRLVLNYRVANRR